VTALRHLAWLLIGAVVGLASVIVHRTQFPWGMLVVLATTFAVPWRLLRSERPRTTASYAAGWLVVVAVAVKGRPEGDYVLAGDVEGYLLLGAGLVLVVVGIVSLARGRDAGA
jgi:Family of unknown function (DUF6113)